VAVVVLVFGLPNLGGGAEESGGLSAASRGRD
jgi:hypothetical protein